MKRIRKWTAGALALILSLSLTLPAFAADTWETEVSLSATFGQSDARSMLQMINNFRTGDEAYYKDTDNTTLVPSKGEPLSYSYALEEIAMQRAAEIALSFSHTRPDGTRALDTATASDGTESYGENIAAGNPTAETTFKQWREDDRDYSGQGHRRNMLDPQYQAVGVGHAVVDGTHYWVQEFGFEPDSAPETAPADTAQDVTIKIASSRFQSVQGVSVNPNDGISVKEGQSVAAPTVSASVTLTDVWPKDSAVAVTVLPVWSSSDETVATVSGQQITGVKAGNATLTFAAFGATESASVTVTGGETPTPTQNPVLALSNIPGLGDSSRFEGAVYIPGADAENVLDTDLDTSAYGVAVYIQPGDGQPWWYKPYDGAGLSVLNPDKSASGYVFGRFSVTYYSEGENADNDRASKYVHLLLLPAGENPVSDNYEEMRGKALEVVTVTRTENDATASPKHAMPEVPPPPPMPHPFPANPNQIMLDVGFHTDGSAPGSALSEEHIRKHLEKLVGWAGPLRFYSCAESLWPAYEISKELGFVVAATANLTKDDAENKAELDRAAELLNSGLAKVCAVGNETLFGNVLTPEQLVSYIAYLRGKLTVNGDDDPANDVYLTTADNVQNLLKTESAGVRDACDFLFMHDYPYYGSVDPDKQLAALSEDYKDLKATNGNPSFQVYIGESGYPSAGETMGKAVASEEEAARYFGQVREWALNESESDGDGVSVFTFSAFDEPGKTGDEAEKHFGLISATEDGALKLKAAYGKLDAFQSIAATVYGNSLSLRGNIGVNFYLTLPTALTADADAYVTLNGEKYLLKDAEHGGIADDPNGDYYKFTWAVPAKRMNDPVTIQVFTGKDIPYLLIDRNGADYTDGYSYSVAAYLKQVQAQSESGALRELVDAMSDYGSFAQTFFQYDTASAAPVTSAIASVTADNFAAYEPQIAQTENAGISYVGSNLTLESETTLRHFFKLESGHSVSEYAFTVDGESVTPVSRPEGYCVEIPDIVAKNLGKSYAVTVSRTSGGDAVTITNYSALSYGYRALNSSSDEATEALLNLVKALYLYNRKADAYFTA